MMLNLNIPCCYTKNIVYRMSTNINEIKSRTLKFYDYRVNKSTEQSNLESADKIELRRRWRRDERCQR